MKQTTIAFALAMLTTLIWGVPENVRAELLLHFGFDQVDTADGGITFTTPDSSGRGNTGTLAGEMSDLNLVSGRIGNALQFEGGTNAATRDRVSILADNLDFNRTYTEFSFAAWIKATDVAPAITSTTWVAGKMGGSGNRGWQTGLTGTVPDTNPNEILFGYFDAPAGTEQEVFLGPNESLANDTWVHLAVVFKASDYVKLYINGTLARNEPTVLTSMNGQNNAEFQIGNRGNSIAASWTGLIDEVYVYDNVLSDEDILALATVPDQPGDFNEDGFVNAADYVTWRDGLNGSFTVEQYDEFYSNFGTPSGGGASALVVPEPASALLLLIALVAVLGSCRGRSRA